MINWLHIQLGNTYYLSNYARNQATRGAGGEYSGPLTNHLVGSLKTKTGATKYLKSYHTSMKLLNVVITYESKTNMKDYFDRARLNLS